MGESSEGVLLRSWYHALEMEDIGDSDTGRKAFQS
jgi:hypothetical protein